MTVGNKAIDRLKLDKAFVQNTFRPFNACWTVRMDSELLVVDDDIEKYSCFSDNPDDKLRALIVINKQNKEIVLLSIDNKLITNCKGGIADCALFDEKQFNFIEFKTNAFGHSENAVRDNFDKAKKQLKNTIKVFVDRLNNVGIQFIGVITLSCHIVVSHSFPKSKAVKQEYQLAFADETGIELKFSEKIYW
ncbi:hypothetical protein [Hoylesella oralis]|uniref:hypothetical protein n=1 Tax=Hoylesella oralis TaxID=28134 RepID=UPI0028E59717|nr:hypothetical protein [Hoylesella oralis]